MFTGIIEELGEVIAVEAGGDAARLRLRGPLVTADARHGDSLAVNGVCLTVTGTGDGEFTADVMAETLRRSNLSRLAPGDRVNLERPVPLGGRLGGHLVQGHVDATATLLRRTPGSNWETVAFSLPEALARYVVEKGSLTVDGVSLTVAGVGPDSFTVGLIPATLASTTLGLRQPGEWVNLEADILGKYVERLLAHGAGDTAGGTGAAGGTGEAVPR